MKIILHSDQKLALDADGIVIVRDGDYLVTIRKDKFMSMWKRGDGTTYTKRHTTEDATMITEDIKSFCPAIELMINGKKQVFSFKDFAGMSETIPVRRFSPEETEPQKELENISKVNLALMRGVQGANPELWKAAQEYNDPNEAFKKLLKSSQNKA